MIGDLPLFFYHELKERAAVPVDMTAHHFDRYPWLDLDFMSYKCVFEEVEFHHGGSPSVWFERRHERRDFYAESKPSGGIRVLSRAVADSVVLMFVPVARERAALGALTLDRFRSP